MKTFLPYFHFAPTILIFLITLTILGKLYKLLSASCVAFSTPHSNLFGHLFSNALSLCPSINVRHPVLQLNSTVGNIIVLYISICKFLEKRREEKKCLYWKIPWIFCFKSIFDFFVNSTLILNFTDEFQIASQIPNTKISKPY